MSKWNGAWAEDTAERVGTTAIYGLITMITADQTGAVSGDPQQWWLVIGVPSLLSLLKCTLANMRGGSGDGGTPTASIVQITSTKEPVA